MFLDFGMLFNAVLFAVGVYWCYEMFGRWRSDLADLRDLDDSLQKLVIVGLWLVTLVIAVFVANFAVALIIPIVQWGSF